MFHRLKRKTKASIVWKSDWYTSRTVNREFTESRDCRSRPEGYTESPERSGHTRAVSEIHSCLHQGACWSTWMPRNTRSAERYYLGFGRNFIIIMSRLAKKPIILPSKTEASFASGVMTVKGPLGEL